MTDNTPIPVATESGPRHINDLPLRDYTKCIDQIAQAFEQARYQTIRLAEPLSPEDQQLQSMPDASPVRWHLAHTTWFFETFILKEFEPAWTGPDPAAALL